MGTRAQQNLDQLDRIMRSFDDAARRVVRYGDFAQRTELVEKLEEMEQRVDYLNEMLGKAIRGELDGVAIENLIRNSQGEG